MALKLYRRGIWVTVAVIAAAACALAQPGGTLRGTVMMEDRLTPLHKATILIVQLGRTVETNEQGIYEFANVPPGKYEIVARAAALTDEKKPVQIAAGATATLDFELRLAAVRQEITVTASGREQTAFEAFQSVTTLDSIDLAEKAQTSIGEVLDGEPGVAKRSFGPGPSRPVIRGFDGDRVMILQDGISTGSLSSQSGDHGESLDASTLERLEVVKGPSALLYGSNGLGGVVNAVTRQHELLDHPHQGFSGYLTAVGGPNNGHGGGSGGFEYGYERWLLWGSGSGQRTGDYHTPLGRVENSHTRIASAAGGFGWYGPRTFFTAGYQGEDSRYGIPSVPADEASEHEQTEIASNRQNLRFTGGVRNLGPLLETFRLSLNHSRWLHSELDEGEQKTHFDNKQFSFRAVFDQRKKGRLGGSFGFSGSHRNYRVTGEEAIAPPVDQNTFAIFGLEELEFEKIKLQFAARIEQNTYKPLEGPRRGFAVFSGAAGFRVPLWTGGAFVTNYTHSSRAPALEELYNNGPHPGNLTFEIGNARLRRERGDGIEFSLRHSSSRIRGETNFFYYGFQDFVFLAPTGRIVEDFFEAEYRQADSRFLGGEASLDVGAHSNLWLHFAVDAVNARLTATDTPLPRIPPVRGRIGLAARFKGLSLKPQLTLTNAQSDVFVTETRTAGFALVDFIASYSIVQTHASHVFSLTAFNLGNRVYRNHLSFLKDRVAEIGRGVRFSYTVRFF